MCNLADGVAWSRAPELLSRSPEIPTSESEGRKEDGEEENVETRHHPVVVGGRRPEMRRRRAGFSPAALQSLFLIDEAK